MHCANFNIYYAIVSFLLWSKWISSCVSIDSTWVEKNPSQFLLTVISNCIPEQNYKFRKPARNQFSVGRQHGKSHFFKSVVPSVFPRFLLKNEFQKIKQLLLSKQGGSYCNIIRTPRNFCINFSIIFPTEKGIAQNWSDQNLGE